MSADKPDLTKAPRRPWRRKTTGNLGNGIEAYAGRHTYDGDDGYSTVLLYQAPSDRDEEREAIAELVLRAVNGYDRHLALIAALTEALERAEKSMRRRVVTHQDQADLDDVRSALKPGEMDAEAGRVIASQTTTIRDLTEALHRIADEHHDWPGEMRLIARAALEIARESDNG